MSISVSLGEVIRAEMAGIAVPSEAELAALEQHYGLLLKWNARLNLTTVTEPREAAVRHYCESLFLAAHLSAGSSVDIGSGPGFPGIPTAIMRPNSRVDLVESHQRKAVFLREAARGLVNVRVLSMRAEQVTDRYDWLVSRAVDPQELLKLRIAERFALLVGVEDAEKLGGTTVIPLPWGKRRALALGSFRK